MLITVIINAKIIKEAFRKSAAITITAQCEEKNTLTKTRYHC